MSTLLARVRRWHAAAAPIVLTPLLLTVCSGMAYRLLKDWGGLGLLWKLGSGVTLLSQRWRQRSSSADG